MLSRKEVAERFGVSYETIRNWEAKGILKPDYVSPTNKVSFSEEQIKALYAKTTKIMLSRKEVAERFGVSYETIRNWEAKGILKPDYVSPTNRVSYSDEQIEALYLKTTNRG